MLSAVLLPVLLVRTQVFLQAKWTGYVAQLSGELLQCEVSAVLLHAINKLAGSLHFASEFESLKVRHSHKQCTLIKVQGDGHGRKGQGLSRNRFLLQPNGATHRKQKVNLSNEAQFVVCVPLKEVLNRFSGGWKLCRWFCQALMHDPQPQWISHQYFTLKKPLWKQYWQ